MPSKLVDGDAGSRRPMSHMRTISLNPTTQPNFKIQYVIYIVSIVGFQILFKSLKNVKNLRLLLLTACN